MTQTQHSETVRLRSPFLAALFVCTAAACQTTGYPPPPRDVYTPAARVELVAGDVVEVKFFRTPELDETQTVRPDKKISLQLVGDVDVTGLSPSELRQKLIELYDPILHDADITVLLRSLESQKVFVGGQVTSPGRFPLMGELTALEAIMEAGGFDHAQAEPRNVVVIRNKGSQRYGYSLDLRAALNGEPRQPFYLEPRDIVYVPRTNIAKLGQWIDQHINKLIPQAGFTWSSPVGASTVGIDTSAR